MKITIEDVAKKAGVSKATVSRVLNGQYQHVTEETKQRVLAVIQELDYRPNALARGLKQNRTNLIGIILSNLRNPFWSSVLEGVEDACRNAGYNLVICNSNEEAFLEEEHIKGLQTRQVDGIIVNPTVKNKPLFESLIKSHYPLVLINRRIDNLKVDMVVMDNIYGARLAIEHLLSVGRKKIAILLYPLEGVSPRQERLEGYKQALSGHGLPIDEKLIKIVPEYKGSCKEAVIDWIKNGVCPDAIFSTNNVMTLEVLEGIQEAGLCVPDDIAVIGYDETVWSKHLNPPLTTIQQPAYQMGELAAQRLIKLIEAKRKPRPKVQVLAPNIIIRQSCGAKKEK